MTTPVIVADLRATVLLLLLTANSGLVNTLPAMLATVSPPDGLVFIGEVLKVTCQLLDKVNISVWDMSLEIYSPGEKRTWKIPQVTVIDNRTISAEINITEKFSSYPTVTCRADQNKWLSAMAFYVEKPLHITNFIGTYYFDNSSIVTSWNHGENYLDPCNIQVFTDWNPFSPPNMSANNCSISTNRSCTMIYRSQNIIYFRIKVWLNRKRPPPEYLIPLYETSVTSLFEFRAMDNMQTGPPKSLAVQEKNSTCVKLTWIDSDYFISCPQCDMIYQIEVRRKGSFEDSIVIVNGLKRYSEHTVQLCALEPHMTFTLVMKVKAKELNPWSIPESVEVTMDEDRPVTGPPLTNTSYSVGECVKNKREITLYWKDPSKKLLRGELTKFEINIGNKSQILREGTNYYRDTAACDSAYDIQIYAATSVGLSLSPSEITIPKEKDELVEHRDLMVRVKLDYTLEHKSKMNITVTWQLERHVDTTTLIMYMCQKAYIANTCFNDYMIKEVDLSRKGLVLHGVPSSTDHFGYALINDKGQKRGIQWINCIYNAENLPEQPVVQVSPGNEPNSLIISWTSNWCNSATKILILRYYIYICRQPVGEDSNMDKICSTITIDKFNKNTYIARDLDDSCTYSIYLKAESPAGKGLRSNIQTGRPYAVFKKVDVIIGSLIGSMAVAIFLGAIVFTLFRRCSSSKKRISDYILDDGKTFFENISWQESVESKFMYEIVHNPSRGGSAVPPVPTRIQYAAEEEQKNLILPNASCIEIQKDLKGDEAEREKTSSKTQIDTSKADNTGITSKEDKEIDNSNKHTACLLNSDIRMGDNSQICSPYMHISNADLTNSHSCNSTLTTRELFNSETEIPCGLTLVDSTRIIIPNSNLAGKVHSNSESSISNMHFAKLSSPCNADQNSNSTSQEHGSPETDITRVPLSHIGSSHNGVSNTNLTPQENSSSEIDVAYVHLADIDPPDNSFKNSSHSFQKHSSSESDIPYVHLTEENFPHNNIHNSSLNSQEYSSSKSDIPSMLVTEEGSTHNNIHNSGLASQENSNSENISYVHLVDMGSPDYNIHNSSQNSPNEAISENDISSILNPLDSPQDRFSNLSLPTREHAIPENINGTYVAVPDTLVQATTGGSGDCNPMSTFNTRSTASMSPLQSQHQSFPSQMSSHHSIPVPVLPASAFVYNVTCSQNFNPEPSMSTPLYLTDRLVTSIRNQECKIHSLDGKDTPKFEKTENLTEETCIDGNQIDSNEPCIVNTETTQVESDSMDCLPTHSDYVISIS